MLLKIDAGSRLPIYRQIHDQIVSGIAHGALAPGDSLPSVRSLASDIGVNLHTVNKAYACLRDEGYIDMRGRRGAVVASPSSADKVDAVKTDQSKIGEAVFRAALEWRAHGGTQEGFLECAYSQAAQAFGSTCGSGQKPASNVADPQEEEE